MDAWLFIIVLVAGLFAFLFFIIWMDWLYKCRKSVKDNSLTRYVTGFLLFNLNNAEELIIFDGILGVNEEQLVFAHRFQNEAIYMANEISSICSFVPGVYNEDEFFEYAKSFLIEGNGKIIMRSMVGVSVYKKLPKRFKGRRVCKINRADGWSSLFFYKDTLRNLEIVEDIQRIIK